MISTTNLKAGMVGFARNTAFRQRPRKNLRSISSPNGDILDYSLNYFLSKNDKLLSR
jgi:hypothetical protein